MLETLAFQLCNGVLLKKTIADEHDELCEEICERILSEINHLSADKIECYHGCMETGWTDGEMVFDYLILYRIDKRYYKPIVIKNGVSQGHYLCKYFESNSRVSNIYVNQLLEMVCESSRDKFQAFLQEKYCIIRQDVLLF